MNKRLIGSEKEQTAIAYLKDLGYAILDNNFRCRIGEIDIIAKEDNVLIFVEVKYRKNNAYGYPSEAVDFRKQKKICQVALTYCMFNHIKEDTPMRFDVIGISSDGKIEHIKNAFQAIL